MARYDITKEATDDLYGIWEYTVDTWSEDQADKYYAILEAAFNEIASAPGANGLYPPFPAIAAYLLHPQFKPSLRTKPDPT